MKRINFETAKLASIVFPNQPVELDYTVEDDDGKVYFIPYQAELQEWLRNEYKIQITIDSVSFDDILYKYIVWDLKYNEMNSEYIFPTYEEALEEGLVQALKLIIEKKI